jgi:hypothetical protein
MTLVVTGIGQFVLVVFIVALQNVLGGGSVGDLGVSLGMSAKCLCPRLKWNPRVRNHTIEFPLSVRPWLTAFLTVEVLFLAVVGIVNALKRSAGGLERFGSLRDWGT